MKKFIYTIIALLGILMPNTTWAEEIAGSEGTAEPYAVLSDDNTVLTFYYDDQKDARNGMDVGPFQSIDDGNPETVNSGWNSSRETITKVVFDESFANCTSIRSTAYWFYYLKALTEIEGLTNFKTDNVTDMYGMFYNCSSLKSLDLSAFNTSNVTCMVGVFDHCSSLTSLDLSSFNTENVTVFAGMFWSCFKLESLDLSNFNTEKCKDFSDMFKECLALKSINVSSFNTANATDMTAMFGKCESLTSIDVSSFNTEKVTQIGYMFGDCTSLTSLDLSSFNTGNVVDMEYMFRESPNLKTIYVSDKWNTTSATGSEVFRNCTGLVGGQGTKFDANHIDASYAHIDGGAENPGYFTDIADKGKEKKEQVETPYWNFEEDSLVLYNITEGATIYYEMENWETQEQADSLELNMTVNERSNVYSKAIAVEDNFVLKMFAAKEGMENSNDTTFVYNYKLWKQLKDVMEYADDIFYKAKESGKVDSLLLADLDDAIMEGQHMYHHRSFAPAGEAQMCIERLSEVIKLVEEQLNATSEQVATPTFKFVGDSLYVSCATEGAEILYKSSAMEGEFEDGWALYSGPIYMPMDFKMIAKATKEGMEESEPDTLMYYYTEWQNLIETIKKCTDICDMIMYEKPSDNILKMIYDVEERMHSDMTVYDENRLEWDRETIIEEREKLEEYMSYIEHLWREEQEQKTNASYGDYTLTVEGDISMAEALEQVGGREKVAKDIAAIVWNSSKALTRSDIEGFGNPNLLIYVQTDSLAPEGVNNVVIDGMAKNIVLVDAEGNNNFWAPQDFMAESISYTREFKQTTEKDVSRGWEGICLPFTVQKFTHESHGEIAPFGNDASIFHFWLHQMTDKGMVNATTIKANKPYIISMPNNGSYPEAYNQAGKVTFSAQNTTVSTENYGYLIDKNEDFMGIASDVVWSSDSSLAMVSTFLKFEAYEYIYALNVGHDLDGYAEGSVFVKNYRDVKPFEVFTTHDPNREKNAGARYISVSSLFGGEGTTGIIDVMKTVEHNGETWYDMNGRRLQGKPSRKGVYIMNGKKVVVK